jgi:hypothetical protein
MCRPTAAKTYSAPRETMPNHGLQATHNSGAALAVVGA